MLLPRQVLSGMPTKQQCLVSGLDGGGRFAQPDILLPVYVTAVGSLYGKSAASQIHKSASLSGAAPLGLDVRCTSTQLLQLPPLKPATLERSPPALDAAGGSFEPDEVISSQALPHAGLHEDHTPPVVVIQGQLAVTSPCCLDLSSRPVLHRHLLPHTPSPRGCLYYDSCSQLTCKTRSMLPTPDGLCQHHCLPQSQEVTAGLVAPHRSLEADHMLKGGLVLPALPG